jgi:hypothetical protein
VRVKVNGLLAAWSSWGKLVPKPFDGRTKFATPQFVYAVAAATTSDNRNRSYSARIRAVYILMT